MQIAIHFNPAEDNADEVIEAVESIYLQFGESAQPLVAPASAPAGTAPVTQAAATQRDAEGLPWDARIHTDPAKVGKDGKWSAKRKLDAAFVAQVKAELMGTPAAGANVPAQLVTPAATPALTLPALTLPAATPAPVVLTGYQELVKLFGEHLQTAENPQGRMSDAWARQSLLSLGVANGQLEAAAAMPDDQVRQIVAAFRGALGV
jgi:hypothetical protein